MINPTNCPSCGREIQYDSSHQAWWNPDIIACICKTNRSLTVVAVNYQSKWYAPEFFLKINNKSGIMPVLNELDKRTFHVLRYYAMYEETGFVDQPYSVVRILWENGNAVGFYTDNNYFGDHGIGHIFIRKEYRRQGKATQIINYFLKYDSEISQDVLYSWKRSVVRSCTSIS